MGGELQLIHVSQYPDWMRRGMRVAVLEGCAFGIWFNAVNGNYLTGLALFLGAGGTTLGILGAVPSLANVLQVFVAPIVGGRYPRRPLLAVFAGIQRFGAVLAGLLALALPHRIALTTFVVLFVVSWSAIAPSVVLWQEVITDLIPLEIRGRYMGMRSAWIQVAGLSTALLCGWVLDRWSGIVGLRAVFSVGLVGAMLNLASWFFHADPPPTTSRSLPAFWDTVLSPFRWPSPHRTATIFFAAWNFAQGLAVPFYSVMLIHVLGLSFWGASTLTTVAGLSAIATGQFWGRLQDRSGDAKTIGLLTSLLAAVPVMMVLGRHVGWPILILAHVIHGSAFNGVQVASLNLNLRLAPVEQRSAYLAALGAASGLAGFLAPVIVGPFTTRHLVPIFIAATLLSLLLALSWWMRLGMPLGTMAVTRPSSSAPAEGKASLGS